MFPKDVHLILACGFDHLRQLRGGVSENLLMLREAWQDPDIQAAVRQRRAERGQAESFGELLFDKGYSLRNAQRKANCWPVVDGDDGDGDDGDDPDDGPDDGDDERFFHDGVGTLAAV